ncbi:cytochrome ubiquinol oxidase subunit I [Lapillicoccus jejuensis]|uniref:Cytochrome bd-I ubiquinol oxidase subunit 1 apoprotein n=1 Tax=Lapillicoccus jejuensis TaxID=402171 RepID=A0A542DYK1_9MICO|nr:cytochrome ubiquinol oxidase subunit I [Lapillicoccus jejuensis]TQJ08175.1 cytochrome bd-I ubiquinol oxidase subunit 1 apoprotein [Lapillicoccus jejuensis]
MSAVDLARWQFAITTVYHFLFVPVTIGLSALVAWFQTQHVRTHREEDQRLALFFGRIFVINFALGLVTGIVQEFQFGMNWSDYSRFVGDVFGAPLALEALLAFFLESTFLGLWIFGRGRIPEKLHAASIWLVHVGTLASAYFILAANSFMQNPVGYRYDPATGRAEMTDFVAILTNKVQLVTFPHTVLASYLVGGAVVMGVALWRLVRRGERTDQDRADVGMYRRATRVGAVVTLVAGALVAVSGDVQGKIMTEVQPMKMAAAEALYATSDSRAPFSVFTIGSLDGSREKVAITVPGLLSFLATGSVDGKVEGINDLKAQYEKQYGASGNPLVADSAYVPTIPVTYWTFRLMIGVGMLASVIAAAVLWLTRGGRVPERRGRLARPLLWAALASPFLPVLGNAFGWIFTETGRQPWLVFGLMTTRTGVSPSVSAGEVLTSMVVFTLLYGVLAVVEMRLVVTTVRQGAGPAQPVPGEHDDASDDPEHAPLAYAH